MKNIVIIFGYNNTRVYDIERLKKLSREMLSADIMLCKEEITSVDTSITPYTLKINLAQYDEKSLSHQIKEIDEYISSQGFTVCACLPFSDKGIPLGSLYAKHKGLPHDNTDRSVSCIDKYIFRCLEKNVYDIALTKSEGQTITNNLKDNSHFTGYVVCQHETINGLRLLLDQMEKIATDIYIVE